MEQLFNRGVAKALESAALCQLEQRLQQSEHNLAVSEAVQCIVSPRADGLVDVELVLITRDDHKRRLFGKGDMSLANLSCEPAADAWLLVSHGPERRGELLFYPIPASEETDHEILVDSGQQGAPFPKKNVFDRATVALLLRHLRQQVAAVSAIDQLAQRLGIDLEST